MFNKMESIYSLFVILDNSIYQKNSWLTYIGGGFQIEEFYESNRMSKMWREGIRKR